MGKDLQVGPGFTLPADAVTQTFGIIGRRGSGKTHCASVLAEEFCERGLPFVVLDPTGAWWGLRTGADGKGKGYPVVILGGQHGDLPLPREAGALVADLVVNRPGFYVLDLSSTESNAAQQRIVTDFLERVYRAKATKPSPLHIFMDEADCFAPQRPMPGEQRMLGAVEAVVRRGRSRGLGVTLITQRPAVLNKNALSQVECMLAFQTTAPQDRKALKEWADGHDSKGYAQTFLDGLAGLHREGFVWSPAWLDTFSKMKVRDKRTYDSSKTPTAGDRAAPEKIAPIDLDAVSKMLVSVAEEVKANDPAVLHGRISFLEGEVTRLTDAVPDARIEQIPALDEDDRTFIETTAREIQDALKVVDEHLGELVSVVESISEKVAAVAKKETPKTRVARTEMPPIEAFDRNHPMGRVRKAAEGDIKLRAGARRMLQAIVNFPAGLNRSQVAVLAEMQGNGGTWDAYVSDLRRGGWIMVSGDIFLPTALAQSKINRETFNPTALVARWRDTLRAGARRMFDVLVTDRSWWTKEALADRAGLTVGGTVDAYWSDVKRTGLFEFEPQSGMRLRTDLNRICSGAGR